jgi:hypothetical protein
MTGRRSDNRPAARSAEGASRPLSGERSLDAAEHSRTMLRRSDGEDQSHGSAGGFHVGVVDAVFDVAMSLALAVQRDVPSASVCARSALWILPRFPRETARRSGAICITDNDTDKLGVSDPGDRAGSGCRGAPRGRSRPVPCFDS